MPTRTASSAGRRKMPSVRPNFDQRMSRDDMFLQSGPARRNIDKRVSRDDMDLGLRSSRAHPTAFHRAQQLAPISAIPQFEPPQLSSTAIRDSATSGNIPIGIALGSPSQPVEGMLLRPEKSPVYERPPEVVPEPRSEAPVEAATRGLQRTKTGRRRLFGFFGGGKKAQEQVDSQSSANNSNVNMTSISPAISSSSTSTVKSPTTPVRSNTVTDKRPKHQPLIVRTNTEPYVPIRPEEPIRPRRLLRHTESDAKRRALEKPSTTQRSESTRHTPKIVEMPSPVKPEPKLGPLLNVEIPDTTLERYSVMFGSLLKPQGQQEQNPSASSLLARRQATLGQLKTITTTSHEEDDRGRTQRRRASSPQPAKSPAFTLFPPTPHGKRPEPPETSPPPPPQQQLPSSRFRSNTSPAQLHSPVVATWEHDPMRVDRGKHNFLKVSHHTEHTPIGSSPGTIRPLFNQSQSSLILESPTRPDDDEDEDEADIIIHTDGFRPIIQSPEWQMLSPPPSSSESPRSSRPSYPPPPSRPAPTVIPTAAQAPQQSKQRNNKTPHHHQHHESLSIEIEETDPELKHAVECSIARQISISHQQRRLLRPLQKQQEQLQLPHKNSSGSSSGRPTVSPLQRAGRSATISETKISTPTLVTPRMMPGGSDDGSDDPGTARAMAAQYRKSERVVLEAA